MPVRSRLRFELVAQGEIFESNLLTGAERGGECRDDCFEHPGMLCSPSVNRNGLKADEFLGRYRGSEQR